MLKLTYDLALECSAQRYLDELAAANPGGSWRTVAFSENTKRHSYYAQCLGSRCVCARLSLSLSLDLCLCLCPVGLSLELMEIISKT